MNERIKELAQQAGYTKDMFGIGHWDMPECQKFAQLIVKECVAQCEQVATDADIMTKSKFITDAGHAVAMGTWGGAKNCSEQIKLHFGVEE